MQEIEYICEECGMEGFTEVPSGEIKDWRAVERILIEKLHLPEDILVSPSVWLAICKALEEHIQVI
jgi:hypothetical protein